MENLCISRKNLDFYFNERITSNTYHKFLGLLKDLEQEYTDVKNKYNLSEQLKVNLYLATYGGSLHYSIAIYEIIKKSPFYFTGIVQGHCASGGTIILMACDVKCITNYSTLLIHELSDEIEREKLSKLKEHIRNDEILNTLMKKIYLTNCSITDENLTFLLNSDRYLTASECIENGIVSMIV